MDRAVSDCIFTGNISLSPTDNACIDLCYSSGSITDCIISDNTGSGIRIESYSLEVDSCTISGNSEDGIKHYSGNSYIHFCNFFDNDGYGVYNLTSSDIDARYCWWGDASGPGGVGPGAGDEVSTHVLYDPWLTEMGIGAADPSTQVELHVSPNPFSSNATVSFNLPNTGLVTIQVFDLSGRKIEEGIECFLEAGNQMIQLDGSEWSPGVYLIHLNSANTNVTQRCVLVR